MLARQSGTRCHMNLEILTVLMAINDSQKQFFSADNSVTSTLELCNEMCYINLQSTNMYLLTHLLQME